MDKLSSKKTSKDVIICCLCSTVFWDWNTEHKNKVINLNDAERYEEITTHLKRLNTPVDFMLIEDIPGTVCVSCYRSLKIAYEFMIAIDTTSSNYRGTGCRLCAIMVPVNKLVDLKKDVSLCLDITKKLTRLNVSIDFSNSTLPATVCHKCCSSLHDTYTFVTAVEQSSKFMNEDSLDPVSFVKIEGSLTNREQDSETVYHNNYKVNKEVEVEIDFVSPNERNLRHHNRQLVDESNNVSQKEILNTSIMSHKRKLENLRVTKWVTLGQLEQLWKFLNERKDVALGHNKKAQARVSFSRFWQHIAKVLNCHGDGAVKDARGWAKYWTDYKCKLRKAHAAYLRSIQETGGGQSSAQLGDIEKKFLLILGDNLATPWPGARVDALETDNTSEASRSSDNILPDVSLPLSPPIPSPTLPQPPPLPASLPLSSPPLPPNSLPSSPLPSPPPKPQHVHSISDPSHQGSRRGAFVRRRRSQVNPMMALLAESQKQTRCQEQRVELFRQLVQEVREIKELLQVKLLSNSKDAV